MESNISNTNIYKVSVIVPVYNVEQTLDRCVSSILAQTFDSFEIILVNDGSTDKSAELCDEYASLHDNIYVVHKENGGLGSARNAGINQAKGKYICFVDSDDYIQNEYIKSMYDAAEEYCVDLVITGYRLQQGQNFSEYIPRDIIGVYSGDSYYKILLEYAYGNSYFYFAWNKLYRHDLITKHNLHFIDRHCAEDMMFNAEYYDIAHSLVIVSGYEYIYTIENLNSLSNRRRDNFWRDMKLVFEVYQKIYKKTPFFQSQVNNLILVLLRNTLSNYISNEIFNMRDSICFAQNCINDSVLLTNVNEIEAYGLYNKITLYFIKYKNYRSYLYLIKIKSYIKWHMFPLFIILRKFV